MTRPEDHSEKLGQSPQAARLLLKLFRLGHDTHALSRMSDLSEPVVDRMIRAALEGERQDEAEWSAAGEPRS